MRLGAQAIKRRSFLARFVFPVGSMLVVMLALLVVYNHAWRLGSPLLKTILAWASGVPLFCLLYFSAVILYPMIYFRGGGPVEQVVGSFAPQAAWWLKEISRAGAYFTFPETLYYGLSQVFLVAFAGNVAVMGVAELVCRARARRRGGRRRVLTWGPVLAILIGLSGIYFMALWGDGERWFYVYQEVYRALFR
ncbi:MAG: hypothetical protein KJ621_13680 [Proteobacteria bacterium]|nr:hypothetical protein [Pseudomonadota bacterium]MBU1740816.1 hypothetical protein [Pseudomonadota bacterium]